MSSKGTSSSGGAVSATAGGLFNALATPAYAPASTADLNALQQQAVACGTGRAADVAVTALFLLPGLGEGALLADSASVGAGTSLARYDADFALAQLTRSGSATASGLVNFAESQGWTRIQTATGPIKYVDENGVTRLTIKNGSPRAPGSNFPHVEMRNAAGQRVGPYGNAVMRRSPGNHTPITWDLP